jgi:hypothetical protein
MVINKKNPKNSVKPHKTHLNPIKPIVGWAFLKKPGLFNPDMAAVKHDGMLQKKERLHH